MTLKLPRERFFTGFFFLFLLTYALLRAWFVAPMHDEVATYFHYIETGKIWGEGALKDANNHLLNSWLGRFSYSIFGTHFFLFRLPAIASFVLYFFASKKLVSAFQLPNFSEKVLFIALNTVPWIFDYFSYTRGYAMGIACFMLAIYLLSRYLNTVASRYLLLLLITLWMMVAANLTYLISGLLLFSYAGFFFLSQLKTVSRQQLIVQLITALLFVLALVPLIQFSFDLKEAGALYYGSLDGFWWVTGKSIARIVLFYDANWLRYLFALFGLVGVTYSIWWLAKQQQRYCQPISWIMYLLVGNTVAILLLAKLLKVNYPEDRAAMYFVPLLICTIALISSWKRYTQPIGYTLLFFPISFVVNMNLSTSIFSPDDRMTDAFYQQVRSHIQPNTTVAVYPIMQLTYALHERKHFGVKHIAQIQRNFEPYSDIILTKTTMLFPSDHWSRNYTVIATDPESTYIALKRKQAWQRIPLFDTLTHVVPSNLEFIPIYSGKIPDSWRNYPIRCDLNAVVNCAKNQNNMNLVVSTNDANGQNIRYDYQNLRWYQGADNTHFNMHLPYLLKKISASESQIVIYIWNPERKKIGLNGSHVQFSALK